MNGLLNRFARWLGLAPRRQRVLLLTERTAPTPAAPPAAGSPPTARRIAPAAPPPAAPAAPKVEAVRKALFAAFNPTRPVDLRADLAGRDKELETLVGAIVDEQAHAVVHGARGSGKTSLARVFGAQADQRGIATIYLACDATDSFAGLIGPYLPFVPATVVPLEREAAFRRQLDALGTGFGPRELVSVLAEISRGRLVFVLDEFDRVTDRKLLEDVATFMKLLSDAHVPLQLLLVGIASNVSDLISLHPSLRRHLIAVGVRRIGVESVRGLIARGARRSGMAFDDKAVGLIEQAGGGSPYHVRLFCHHAGLAALARGATEVDEAAAIDGMASALDRWAALNEDDSALFRHLAEDPASRPVLSRIAAQAIADNGFAPVDEAVGQALGGALVDDGRQVGRSLFRDTLAPQFLLATMIVADRHRSAGDRPLAAGDRA